MAIQSKYALLDEMDSIILGNVEAENIITIVSSPTCEPCSEAHKVLDQWLSERDNFKLQLIFSVTNEDFDSSTKVARHLHKLKYTDINAAKDAIHEWYEHKYKDFETWMEAYPAKDEIDSSSVIEKHTDWCKITNVKNTPTIFLNGYQLPAPWQLERYQVSYIKVAKY